MLNWPAKDPDATYDYRWEPPLDAGDKLATAVITRVSGDVAIGTQQMDDTGLSVVLTAGSVGLNLFRGVWTSVGGRGDGEYIQIAVVDDTPTEDSDLLTAFRMRYPEFDGVAAQRIQYWLTDADRFVTDGWGTDANPARMAYAAHKLILSRAPGISDAANLASMGIPSGVTKFRSASFDVQISEAASNRSLSSGWDATAYGEEFAVMLRRNTGGPMLVGYVESTCGLPGW